jgi:hypothetical protein
MLPTVNADGTPSLLGRLGAAFEPISIYVCAAIGGFLAAIADLVQKEDASAVVKMTKVTARHMEVLMQPYWILMVLVLLAAALCFVFQPRIASNPLE